MMHARDSSAAGGINRVQDLQRNEVLVRRRRVPPLESDLTIPGALQHEIVAALAEGELGLIQILP